MNDGYIIQPLVPEMKLYQEYLIDIRSVCIQTGTKSNINIQGLIFEIWNAIGIQRIVILSKLGMISGTFSDFEMVFTYSFASFKLNWDTCSVNITLVLSLVWPASWTLNM